MKVPVFTCPSVLRSFIHIKVWIYTVSLLVGYQEFLCSLFCKSGVRLVTFEDRIEYNIAARQVRAVPKVKLAFKQWRWIAKTMLCFLWFPFAAREALPTWDKQIQSLCFQVNNLLEKISQTAPEWTAQAMEAQMAQWPHSHGFLCWREGSWAGLLAEWITHLCVHTFCFHSALGHIRRYCVCCESSPVLWALDDVAASALCFAVLKAVVSA